MVRYTTHYQTRRTSQRKPIPGSTQVENNAGGYAWAITDWSRLDRFLILGAEGGSYYVGEQELTVRNAEAVRRCISEDGRRTVARTVEISESGRAPKNEPALFALAMCAKFGDLETRRLAYRAWERVARIGTHLFHLNQYCKDFGIGGRGYRDANARWYNDKTPEQLAYQVVKYQQRDGWSHRDVLRLSHPKATSDAHNVFYRWIVDKTVTMSDLPSLVQGSIWASQAGDKKSMVNLINDFGLTREMIPTKFLNEPSVWEALLEKMPMTAMIRNLGKITNVGLIKPMSNASAHIIAQLHDAHRLSRARIHPLSVLIAMKTYAQGHGMRGKLSWEPDADIIDALDDAFYLAFGNVEPTGKRTMLALDVSGSMSWANIAGMPLTPREGSVALAFVTKRVESQCVITAFSDDLIQVNFSPRERLDDAMAKCATIRMGGTDCALPMVKALENKLEVDTFIVITDNETWAGNIHPVQALNEYRRKMSIPARLAVVGMTSSGFSIADPNDSGCLDLVGFDTATPNIISEFSKGAL